MAEKEYNEGSFKRGMPPKKNFEIRNHDRIRKNRKIVYLGKR